MAQDAQIRPRDPLQRLSAIPAETRGHGQHPVRAEVDHPAVFGHIAESVHHADVDGRRG